MAMLFPMFRGGMAEAENEFNKQYKAKYGVDAPVANAPDQPGDKLASTAQLTEALRQRGGPTWYQALGMGVNSAMEVGSKASVGGLDRMAARGLGIDGGASEEQMRKMNAAVHNLSPGWHTAGMVLGAVPAAAEIGLSAIGTGAKIVGAGAREVAGPAIDGVSKVMSQGFIPRAIANLGYRSAETATKYPLGTASAAGMAAIAGGLGVAKSDIGNYDPPKPAAPQAAPSTGFMLDRDAAYSGKASPAQQYWAQIHDPKTGKLVDGITPAMEARARQAIEVEARNPGMMVAVPEDAFPGGASGAVAWQNQPGYDPVKANDPTRAAMAVPLDEVFAEYEASYPDNREGPMTSAQYAAAKRGAMQVAAQRREDAYNTEIEGFAKTLGVDPIVARALDRSGGLTNKTVIDAIQAQQGPARTPRVPTPKDLSFAGYMDTLSQGEAEIAAGLKSGDMTPEDAAAARKELQKARLDLWRSILTQEDPLKAILAAQMQSSAEGD